MREVRTGEIMKEIAFAEKAAKRRLYEKELYCMYRILAL